MSRLTDSETCKLKSPSLDQWLWGSFKSVAEWLAGARVTALDLTPELLEVARENGRIAKCPDIVWTEGDAEQLPYADGSFDVVLSQFGHMFAPRPEIVVAEMRRVLKAGGRIAFATWHGAIDWAVAEARGRLGCRPREVMTLRAEWEALAAPYFFDNVMHQDFLLTRANSRGDRPQNAVVAV